jgi:hypothetical protein
MNITPKTIAVAIGVLTPLGYISAGIMDSSVSLFLLLCAIISGFNLAKGMILEPQKTSFKTIKFILVPVLLFAIAVIAWIDNSRIPLFSIWVVIFTAMHVLFVASSSSGSSTVHRKEKEAQPQR